MLRPFFPELVMSTDLLSFDHPSVLLFCFIHFFVRIMFLGYHRTVSTFNSWFDLLDDVAVFLLLLLLLFQITSTFLTHGYRSQAPKNVWELLQTSFQISNISFPAYVSHVITHPLFYCDLDYKLWRVKDIANFISSVSKTVKRLQCRQYDPMII